MRLKFLFLATSLTLVSCIPIVYIDESQVSHTYRYELTSHSNENPTESDIVTPTIETVILGCDPYVLPEVGDPPTIPTIPEMRRSDHRYIANVLIDYIQTLINYQNEMKNKYNEAHVAHLSSC